MLFLGFIRRIMSTSGNSLKGLTRTKPLEFDWGLGFTQTPARLAYEYWSACRVGRAMPSRDDLNPAGMRKFSPHVGLIEIRADPDGHTDYFIRRAGGKWEEVYGPMTGRYIQEFLPPHLEGRWRALFDAVLERNLPVCARTGIEFQKKTWLMAEMFVAPLGRDEEVNMLLMCFVTWSASNRTA
jgi:hypothetical protein